MFSGPLCTENSLTVFVLKRGRGGGVRKGRLLLLLGFLKRRETQSGHI